MKWPHFAQKKDVQGEKTLANAISVSRAVIFGPLVMYFLYKKELVTAECLFVGGSLTDLADGFFARHICGKTKLGGQVDSCCDKIFITFAMLGLVLTETSVASIISIVLVTARETYVATIRNQLERDFPRSFPADGWGKFKAWIQYIVVGALILCLIENAHEYIWHYTAEWLHGTMCFITVYTGGKYHQKMVAFRKARTAKLF